MTSKTRSRVLALAVLAMLPSLAKADVTRLTVTGPYTQAQSGMVYPEAVDDFRRVSVIQYKPDGSDISAGYIRSQPGAEIVVTAYTFPMPEVKPLDGETAGKAMARVCQGVAAGVVKSVLQDNPGAKTTAADIVTINQGGPQPGFHAVFAMTVPQFIDRKQEAVGDQAYVFCTGRWVVEYRITYPAATPDFAAKISQFLADLKWTIAPAVFLPGPPPPTPAASSPPAGTVSVPPGVLSKVNQHSRPGQDKDWPVSITVVSPPAHGTVTSQTGPVPVKNAAGATRNVVMTQVFYQPQPGYTGPDSFSYKRTSEDPSDANNGQVVTMNVMVGSK